MTSSTAYIVSVGPGTRSYAMGFAQDGGVTSWSGKPAAARRLDREAAVAAAERLGEWLESRGYGKAAKTLRIAPAGGGARIEWTYKSKGANGG